jgi:serine phosphatase RsbU (regulator of sigma subunit)
MDACLVSDDTMENLPEPAHVAEITPMSPGDILFLYTDGVFDGSDAQDRLQIEQVIPEHRDEPAREVCNAILEYAVKQDENLTGQ